MINISRLDWKKTYENLQNMTNTNWIIFSPYRTMNQNKPHQQATAMNNSKSPTKKPASNNPSRIPEDSTFYQKVVPALLLVMAIITSGLILFALGVLVGVISF